MYATNRKTWAEINFLLQQSINKMIVISDRTSIFRFNLRIATFGISWWNLTDWLTEWITGAIENGFDCTIFTIMLHTKHWKSCWNQFPNIIFSDESTWRIVFSYIESQMCDNLFNLHPYKRSWKNQFFFVFVFLL